MERIYSLTKVVLLPPACFLVLLFGGLLLQRFRRRTGHCIALAPAILLWLASAPWVGATLLQWLQSEPALSNPETLPQDAAIVVLGAGLHKHADEFGGETLGALSLVRVRYAAKLWRQTNLPVLVTGGRLDGRSSSVAELMGRCLEQEFSVPVRHRETESRSTHENAVHSAKWLRGHGIATVALVTHAWHMPRAKASFEAEGLDVIAAPTGFRRAVLSVRSFFPAWQGCRDTYHAAHEFFGILWYRLRY